MGPASLDGCAALGPSGQVLHDSRDTSLIRNTPTPQGRHRTLHPEPDLVGPASLGGLDRFDPVQAGPIARK